MRQCGKLITLLKLSIAIPVKKHKKARELIKSGITLKEFKQKFNLK